MKFFVFNGNEKITFNYFELIGNESTAQFFHKFVKEETQETLLALCSFATAKRERPFLKVASKQDLLTYQEKKYIRPFDKENWCCQHQLNRTNFFN